MTRPTNLADRRQLGCWLLVSAWVAGVLLTGTLPAEALDVPALKRRVNDYAGMLTKGVQRQLEDTLRDLERTDATQIVVLTIPSLKGEILEDYSIRVAEQWKIGQQGLDNGAILLIAKQERKLRIEVGYGLEGRLTDLRAGRIIRNVIVPHFKAGNFDQGVIQGVQAMIETVRGEYAAEAASPKEPQTPSQGTGLFLIALFLFFVTPLARAKRPVGMIIGGVLAPVLGLEITGFNWPVLLLLVVLGVAAGFILGALGLKGSGRAARRRRHFSSGYWYHRGGGRSSSRGMGGFGGGGGGGFGGGGASGSW